MNQGATSHQCNLHMNQLAQPEDLPDTMHLTTLYVRPPAWIRDWVRLFVSDGDWLGWDASLIAEGLQCCNVSASTA